MLWDEFLFTKHPEELIAYEIVKEFFDAAVSGADPIDQRSGFRELLTYMLGNGASMILVESASRFARDLAVQITGHDLLKGTSKNPMARR